YTIFIFSSRRRHTRWPRDWSSDVCSSDLAIDSLAKALADVREGDEARTSTRPGRGRADGARRTPGRLRRQRDDEAGPAGAGRDRSEERRVGKECRYWGGVG